MWGLGAPDYSYSGNECCFFLPVLRGEGPPHNQPGGLSSLSSPQQRCIGRIWQEAISILQYSGDEVFCWPQCAAVQHLLFSRSPSVLVFLATLLLYLETIFFPADDVFDCGFVTAVDSHILQPHSSQLPGRFFHCRKYKGCRTKFLPLLSEGTVVFPCFLLLDTGANERTRQQKKNSGFEDELSEVLESQNDKNKQRGQCQPPPPGNPGQAVNKDLLSNSLDMSICFSFRHLL